MKGQMIMAYDFGGYATRSNVRCSDGRVIMPDAFKDCDGTIVPLVWQHVHDSTSNVLGHAELENRPDGVYAYCSLNNTAAGKDAKEIVQHGDICALSIYANRLQQVGDNVMHGIIREVSLVLAGANPGATIDNLAFEHSDGTHVVVDDEATICFIDEDYSLDLEHADEDDTAKEEPEQTKKPTEDDEDLTVGEILDTMTDTQKQAVFVLIDSIKKDRKEDKEPSKKETAKSEEELEHADGDEDSDSDEDGLAMTPEKLEEILESFTDEESDAASNILEAIASNSQASEEDKKIFEGLSEDKKNVVYLLASQVNQNGGKSMAHADESEESEETIQDVLDTLSKEQTAAYQEILKALEKGEKVSKDVADVFDTFSDKQKDAVYALVGLALENADDADDTKDSDNVKHSAEEGDSMKFNVFDAETNETNVLSHSDMEAIFADAPRCGTLREAVIEHGIADIEVLFPEAQAVNAQPYTLQRRMEWVTTVINGVHKSPFARIKSTAANLTEQQARAKGYVKGYKKIEEQITALRRITTPQTVYKLQKLDRDDIIDITDFDVVAWMKQEMRMMLDEEIARAILVGDGRGASDPEKIHETNIRSVWKDDEMYTIHRVIPVNKAEDYDFIIDEIVRSRKGYKGSGNPIMFIGPDILTEMRLLKDNDNRYRYDSDKKLAEALRMSDIEEVELFDELVRTVEGKDRKLVAIALNLSDYTVGANKGGEVSLFDDFDLDYNKMEYLIETRCSGALTMPKSAIAIEIQTVTDSAPDPVYVKVTNPVTADISDYYERDEYGRYVLTSDAAVVTGKTYYELSD